MTAGDAELFRAAVLEFTSERSRAGQTADVHDGAGAPLATSDGAGTITNASGTELLRAPTALGGAGRKGTDAKLVVSDAVGTPLGEVRVERYSYAPRSSKATLSLTAGGAVIARLEPRDRKGEEIAVMASGAAVGMMRKTSRKRGLLRSTAVYRLELTGALNERTRPLILAAAIRYPALLAAAVTAASRDRLSGA